LDISALNPFVRYARGHYNLKVKNSWSICYDCRLFFIRQGMGSIFVNGKEYNFFENLAIFLPPGSKYRFMPAQDCGPLSVLVFNFDLVDDYSHWVQSLGTASEESFQPQRMPVYPITEEFSGEILQTAPQLYDLLQGTVSDFLTKAPYFRELASATVKQCLLHLLREQTDTANTHITNPVTAFIHTHYQDAALTNDRIAEHFGYHPYYLSQVMKKATGMTLHSYLLYYRIRIAKDYLITTDLDVNTICWKCGFNSCAYFIKQFRLHTGTTPKQYRISHLEQLF